MNKLIPFVFVLISTFHSNAQDFCKASSVFFDLNKSELKSGGQMMVDSLVKSMNGTDFILEVYGYTDTSNTLDYNRKLSQSRIDAVLAYLKSKQIAPKEIRTFNEGEDFNSSNQSKNAAFQRRVDIYLTPMEGNDVVFKSPDGVIIKRDLSSFGNCGICALKPKMKYLQTESEANANGIDLITEKGERLVTYGMVLFDIDTCSSLSADELKKIETCIQMPAVRWDNRVELFELIAQPGNDNWRLLNDSLCRDSIQKTVRFCTRAGCVNLDVRFPPLGLILPEESLLGKSFFTYDRDKKPEKLSNDTLPLPIEVKKVVSYFEVNKEWYLYQDASQKIRKEFTNRDSVSPNFAIIYTSDYNIVPPKGEIELKVKLKDIDKMGYYHPDFDLFLPLERRGLNTWYGTVYQDGFELCYIKNNKYYLEKNKAKKLKIKLKNGHPKAKVKQLYLFKKNKLSWKKAKRRELE
ncbi:OmpA family protein [Fluviicola taffensis]|uniref:OmpA/MotB domain protein n=1 Tax=Fluviicola taffensis (strain DSM 16823 / NCIMB 13979 / RW262) TaxID=755732 RepID=F2ICJ4_FLUTR|nr:OmpA family protein [Fluviicola taffensis]AEA45464.1 OmpA/MotB domain protein [Fluviicola taffensis DSM 16823]